MFGMVGALNGRFLVARWREGCVAGRDNRRLGGEKKFDGAGDGRMGGSGV